MMKYGISHSQDFFFDTLERKSTSRQRACTSGCTNGCTATCTTRAGKQDYSEKREKVGKNKKCRIRKRSACPVSARSSPAESEDTLDICSDGNENRGNHGAVSGKPQALSLTTPPAVGRALSRKCGSATECTDWSELWTRPASPGRGKPTPTKPRQVVLLSIVSDCDR